MPGEITTIGYTGIIRKSRNIVNGKKGKQHSIDLLVEVNEGIADEQKRKAAQAADAQTAQPELPGMVMSPDGTQMKFEARPEQAQQAAEPLVGTPEWVQKPIDEAGRESYSEGNPTQGGMTDGRKENEDEGRGAPGVLQIDLGHDAEPGLHTGGTDANDAGGIRAERYETNKEFARRSKAEGKRVISTGGNYVSYKPAGKESLSREFLGAVELMEANDHVVTLADGEIEKHIWGGIDSEKTICVERR